MAHLSSGQWKLKGLFLPLPPGQVFTHHSLVVWEVAEVLCLFTLAVSRHTGHLSTVGIYLPTFQPALAQTPKGWFSFRYISCDKHKAKC